MKDEAKTLAKPPKHCNECPNSEFTDDGYEYKYRCKATSKRGRTIDWHMHTGRFVDESLCGRSGDIIASPPGNFIETPAEEILCYFIARASFNKPPKWCPFRKEKNNVHDT